MQKRLSSRKSWFHGSKTKVRSACASTTILNLTWSGFLGSVLMISVERNLLDATVTLDFLIPKYAAFTARQLLSAFHTLFDGLYEFDKKTFLSTIVRELDIAVT